MPGAAAASFFDATTQRICDHVGKDWVVRDWSKCSCFCKVHFLTVLPHFSTLFIFVRFPTFFTLFESTLLYFLHFSTFFPSLLSSLLHFLDFLTVLTSLLSSLLSSLLPYCPHFSAFFSFLHCPTVFISLLSSLPFFTTLWSSLPCLLHFPTVINSLLSSLPYFLHISTFFTSLASSLLYLTFFTGSYGRCKGRCLIRVLTLGCGILPANFRITV